MRKWAGAIAIGWSCAACGLDGFGIGRFDDDAGVDAHTGPSSFVDGSLSGQSDGASSPLDAGDGQVDDAIDAAGPDARELVDAAGVDVAADVADARDSASEVDACVPPPIGWTWQCEGQGIGAGSMCVQTSSTGIMGVPMPYDCRQCLSAHNCACVVAHFGEQNACGTAFVDGGNVTIPPASCTDVPEAGQLVVCP